MGGWNVAMDAQTDLVHQSTSTQGTRFLASFAYSMIGNQKDDPYRREAIPIMVNLQAQQVRNAEPMWVADDVCELVTVAASTLKPEPLRPDDLITPHGFAYFDHPVTAVDCNGLERQHRALQWFVINDGSAVLLASYDDWRDDPEEDQLGKIGGADLTLSHVDTISFGASFDKTDEPSAQEFWRLVFSFFRLCQQQIAVHYPERLERSVRRRAADWKQIKEMVVFTLRRPSGERPEPSEGTVDYSHRWLVQGHWRNQPYKENGETVYRQIWIAPYVKGPDGAPLIFKRRAFEFTR